MCKNNGVLFENQLLQIGLKSEFRQNLGEIFQANYLAVLHYQSQCQHDIANRTYFSATGEGNTISGLACCRIFTACMSLAPLWGFVLLNLLVVLIAEVKWE